MIVDTLLAKVIGTANDRELKRIRPFVAEINSKEAEIQRLSDDGLRGKTAEFRQRPNLCRVSRLAPARGHLTESLIGPVAIP